MRMTTTIPESHRDLLQADTAVLATIGSDGRPQLSAVWFLATDDGVKVSLNTDRQKVKNLQRNAAVNLFVLDRSNRPVSTPFTPGTPATLRSSDGHVRVQLPPTAATRVLTLRHAASPLPGTPLVPHSVAGRRGFDTFFLDASDAQGQALHQFNAPLTITISMAASSTRL